MQRSVVGDILSAAAWHPTRRAPNAEFRSALSARGYPITQAFDQVLSEFGGLNYARVKGDKSVRQVIALGDALFETSNRPAFARTQVGRELLEGRAPSEDRAPRDLVFLSEITGSVVTLIGGNVIGGGWTGECFELCYVCEDSTLLAVEREFMVAHIVRSFEDLIRFCLLGEPVAVEVNLDKVEHNRRMAKLGFEGFLKE